MNRALLAVLAGFGVLTAGCTAEDPQSHELSDLADNEYWVGADLGGIVYEATGLIVFDMPVGKSGWVIIDDRLPFPTATDGTNACELPTDQKYNTNSPPDRSSPAEFTHWLRITHTDDGLAVQFDNDKKVYIARMDDYTSTTEYRFTRGMPYSFRPCPPWAQ